MDQASRQRRARKKLESLEQDNFHDDPHADLVRIKKKKPVHQIRKRISKSVKTRKKTNSEFYSKTTFTMTLMLIC